MTAQSVPHDFAQGKPGASEDAPVCAFPGCEQHAVPGSTFCGDEEHAHLTDVEGDDATDGTVNPLNETEGFNDGTGLRKQKRSRHKSRTQGGFASGEVRVTGETDQGVWISGTAIVYGVRTVIRDVFGEFGERIRPGAAAHVVRSNVALLANHDGLPLARTTTDTLQLRDLPHGVDFRAALDPEMPLAQDVLCAIRTGNLSGCSFAFTVAEGGDKWNPSMTEREILRFARVPEISCVTFPAYPTTTVGLDLSPQVSAARAHLRRLTVRGEQVRLIANRLNTTRRPA
jgi:HK97 family phage prohead protease